MKIRTRLTNQGIEISHQEDVDPQPLSPAPDADQANPRRNYLYAHVDADGKIFYIGKGVRRRAWSRDRHPIWSRYVEKHLCGSFQVRILQDNLSPKKADELEAAWIAQCSADLVNWVNMGRDFDFQALDRFHTLRNANRALIQQAKVMEKYDLEQATAMYIQAIEAIREYAFISYERGLVGQLLDEEAEERGRSGEVEALDRLTMCLIKLSRAEEADSRTKSYFALYPLDLQRNAAKRIAKRIEKVLVRIPKGSVTDRAVEQGD